MFTGLVVLKSPGCPYVPFLLRSECRMCLFGLHSAGEVSGRVPPRRRVPLRRTGSTGWRVGWRVAHGFQVDPFAVFCSLLFKDIDLLQSDDVTSENVMCLSGEMRHVMLNCRSQTARSILNSVPTRPVFPGLFSSRQGTSSSA